jgi:hypothetical protein
VISDPTTQDRLPRFLEAILLAVAFALAYTQSPLYFSNQNQYFLHGLAQGGLGHLNRDLLAQTRDPTPVFTALVSAGYRKLGEISFQVAYFLLLMCYFLSVRWLVGTSPQFPDTRPFRVAFAAGFIATHAAILRVASVQLTGVDYPWNLQAGVAGQYLLGAGLQPSAFGALLMTAVAAFASGRPTLAAFLAASTCAFHSTYLLPAGLLVLGFMVETLRASPHSGPTAFRMLLAASAIVVPVCVYILFTFGPTNPDVFEQSQHILAEIRIPHHCEIDRWFDVVAGVQLAWAAIGLVLLRRSPLFVVLAVAAGVGVVLTFIQYATDNPTLALMFPWRISALLVPVASAVIVAKAVALLPPSRWVEWVASAVVLALAGAGVWVMVERLGYRSGDDEQQLYEYVRTHAGPGDMYLLPVRVPAVGNGHGSISTSFTPPPRPKPGSNLIPVDLQRFRLHTGTPLYVDFKSVPYADVEVMTWLQRVRQCEEWYGGNWSRSVVEFDVKSEWITHVVAPASQPIAASYLEEVHSDPAYIVYRVK